jgi:hypothetical protein
MIASALRSEIQPFCITACERFPAGDLARCAASAQRAMRGMRVGAPEDKLPAMRVLTSLVERCAPESATHLAYRAMCECLIAHLGLQSADAFEEALDALDDLVQDPAQLSPLRQQLRTFLGYFEQLCQEATRAPRRQPDLNVSAA